jgi:hypothetical protein
MLDIASDVGAILVHAGYSAEAQALIASRRLPVLNEFRTPEPFWRDPARQMPHNLYTSYDRLIAALAKKPMAVEKKGKGLPYTFSYDGLPKSSKSTPAISVGLDYGPLYAVRYRYDASTRRYLREQDGQPHIDIGGRQIGPATVLTVFVRWHDILVNGSPSSKIDLEGDGPLAIITGGRLTEGRWSRPEGGPLALADRDGHRLVLPPGPVWIELFPVDQPFEVQGDPSR